MPLKTTHLDFKIEIFITIIYYVIFITIILYKIPLKNIVLQCMKSKLIFAVIKKIKTLNMIKYNFFSKMSFYNITTPFMKINYF